MIKSSVTVNLVPQVKTGPWIYWNPLETSISKAAEMGFDGVELFTASANSVDPDLLENLLQRFEIKLSAVGTGAGKVMKGLTLTDPDAEIRKQAISFIRDMISFGARFRAPAIIGSMQGNVVSGIKKKQAIEWLADGLDILGNFAGDKGVMLIFESLNRYETNVINRLEDAVELITSLNTHNVTLLADLFHMNIEEESISGSIRSYGSSIGHVHFADSNRRPVGNGHIQMKDIADALKEIEYKGYISAEAFPWPDSDSAAKATIENFKKYFKPDEV
jgi:sugar phosphate isomerase/epimerase